jgi:cell division septal protein FtsQ
MTKKWPLFACFAITISILLYAAVRFMAGGPAPRKIKIQSDAKSIDPNLVSFIAKNAARLQKLPAEILKNFPNVEHASVKDNLSGSLSFTIRHKKIIGIWTDGKTFYPLGENGAPIMKPLPYKPEKGLVFKGQVPATTAGVIRIISASPELAKRISYMEYVEGRRWDIKLQGGETIMLPESNIEAAAAQIRASGILGKKFGTLDLRDPKRMLVK